MDFATGLGLLAALGSLGASFRYWSEYNSYRAFEWLGVAIVIVLAVAAAH